MVYTIFDESMWVEVEECLQRCGIDRFTRHPEMHGAGRRGGPRHGTAIWPGVNSAVLAVVDEAQKQTLLAGVRELRAGRETAAIRAFVLPVLEMV